MKAILSDTRFTNLFKSVLEENKFLYKFENMGVQYRFLYIGLASKLPIQVLMRR